MHWKIDGTHIIHTELKHTQDNQGRTIDYVPRYEIPIREDNLDWNRQLKEKSWVTSECLKDFQECWRKAHP